MTLIFRVVTIRCINWPPASSLRTVLHNEISYKSEAKLSLGAHPTSGAICLILNPAFVLWKVRYGYESQVPVLPNSCVICTLTAKLWPLSHVWANSGTNTCIVYSCLSQSYRKHKWLTNRGINSSTGEINGYIAIFVLSLQQEVSQTLFWEWNDALVIYQIQYVECTNVFVKVQLLRQNVHFLCLLEETEPKKTFIFCIGLHLERWILLFYFPLPSLSTTTFFFLQPFWR